MKGVVFNILEDVVSEEHGESAWDDLLDEAGVEGAYTAIGSYSDAEFVQLLQCLPGAQDYALSEALRLFGRSAMARLAALYPALFEPHSSTTPFLLTLNDIIHPAVRCLYPGADVPVFDFTVAPVEDGSDLVVGYRSARRLCYLAEGFIEGAAAHFGESVAVCQAECMNNGAPECLISCTFSAGGPLGEY